MRTFDWSAIWTATEAERELHNFKFKGPGWYAEGQDTVLVLADDMSRYHLWTKYEKFHFYIWNNFDPRMEMELILKAPRR